MNKRPVVVKREPPKPAHVLASIPAAAPAPHPSHRYHGRVCASVTVRTCPVTVSGGGGGMGRGGGRWRGKSVWWRMCRTAARTVIASEATNALVMWSHPSPRGSGCGVACAVWVSVGVRRNVLVCVQGYLVGAVVNVVTRLGTV